MKDEWIRMTPPTCTDKPSVLLSAGGCLFHIGSVDKLFMMRVYERGEWYVVPMHSDRTTTDRVTHSSADKYFIFRDRIVWHRSNRIDMKLYDHAARCWRPFDKFFPCAAFAERVGMLSTSRIS